MNNKDLHYARITDIAGLLERRELSPVELTTHMLERISVLDSQLNSYQTVMADQAMAAAKKAESEIVSGHYRGPLHGIPVAVKDLCFTRGVPTKGGLAVLSDFVPDHDATVIQHLESAGAILLGKLNLTEGAMVGYHPDFRIPVNPWNNDLWPGASSSGMNSAGSSKSITRRRRRAVGSKTSSSPPWNACSRQSPCSRPWP